MAGHLALRVVRLTADEVGEVGEVMAVVDEARDALRFVLKYKDGRAAAVGGHAADYRGAERQLDHPSLHRAGLALPADVGHQPRQHGQRGAAVQRAAAHIPQREALLLPFPFVLRSLHLHFSTRAGSKLKAKRLYSRISAVQEINLMERVFFLLTSVHRARRRPGQASRMELETNELHFSSFPPS